MIVPVIQEKTISANIKIGGSNPFFLIAGPCVIENEEELEKAAVALKELEKEVPVGIFFKSSYDKANRSSIDSYRGPGIEKGLKMLQAIKEQYGFSLVTDVHSPEEAERAAEVIDMIQIPAFLSRQTDLIVAAAKTGRWVNVKKGQFMAPKDALMIVDKFRKSGSDKITICERGYTFGYNNLVVDMRGIEMLRREGVPVVIDITHSTQLPGGGTQTGGDRAMAFPIGRAAAAVGVDGVLMEVHSNPENALSDSTTQLPLEDLLPFIKSLYEIDKTVKKKS